MGLVAWQEGDLAVAHSYFAEGLAFHRAVGNKPGMALLLGNLGLVSCDQQDYLSARSLLLESLEVCRELEDKRGIAFSLVALASLALAQNELSRAVRLWAGAEVMREALGAPLAGMFLDRYEQEVAATQLRLDESAFKVAWQEGSRMGLEEAVSLHNLATL